jgi:hypothetical protein
LRISSSVLGRLVWKQSDLRRRQKPAETSSVTICPGKADDTWRTKSPPVLDRFTCSARPYPARWCDRS